MFTKNVAIAFLAALASCTGQKSDTHNQTATTDSPTQTSARTMYEKDRQFLQQYQPDVVELQLGQTKALICPAYQGRIMTTTADGQASYGWINYELIKSGKLLPHMNAFGGEDRFWLGPEGGQYALYFKKGDPFDGDHWQTPVAIDSEPFTLAESTASSARFTRTVSLTNYAGTTFDIGIDRTIQLLDKQAIHQALGIELDSVKVVGIQSDNVIQNLGKAAWLPETGMPSIWILGMMNAASATTIIVPFRPGSGLPINDAYFGKVPAERLVVGKTAAFFKADAAYRSKIGVSPARATNWVGSYDPVTHTLTLVTFDFDPKHHQYVNSAWEQQKEPYSGDVINAYNDGPMKPGQPQMGHFYELESSSPAAALVPGARQQHKHTTFHIQGRYDQLNQLAQHFLQTSLDGLP